MTASGTDAARGTTSRILRGAGVVGVATVVVKAIAFGKELVVASVYGRGDALDSFLLALVVPMMVSGITAGSFRLAFVPVYVRVRGDAGPREADRVATHALIVAVGLLSAVAVALWLAAPWVVAGLARGFDADKSAMTLGLLRSLTPVCLLASLPVMLSGVLESRERFRPAILAQATVPVAVLVAVVAVSDGTDPVPLIAGTLVGLAIQVAVLASVLSRHGHRLRAPSPASARELRAVGRQWLPAAGAMVFQDLTTAVDQAMAAALAPGSVAALSYAYRIVSLPLALIAASLGVAILPVLSDLAARGRDGEFLDQTRRWVRVTLWGGLAVALAAGPFALPVVRLVYERGAFDRIDSHVVASVVVAYLGMVPFFVSGIVAVQAVTARSGNRVLLVVGAINLVVNIVGNVVLSRWFGVAGIALSTVCVYAVSATVLLGWLGTRAAGREA